ncbi:hypothetical protein AYO38_08380 [bacterium SCGC AG-212-C10]|nr:hypothetical protein AYO38_08380 [bacterium SCGC AG-212-C10]
MTAFRSVRIRMPDRPGALSAISTSLAAHGVNIVRLDVVSHEGAVVVDDLHLGAQTQEDIGAALASFRPEVEVRNFDTMTTDPVLELATALTSISRALTPTLALAAVAEGARRLLRGNMGIVMRLNSDSSLEPESGPAGLPVVHPGEPFTPRWALVNESAAAFPVVDVWAPDEYQRQLGPSWVTCTALGTSRLLIVPRRLNIAFSGGEVQRLLAYGEAAAAVLHARGFSASDAMHSGPVDELPARSITLLEAPAA